MAIPANNVLGNPNVTEGSFQVAIEDLRKSVIGSGKAYDSANTYSQYDTCIYGGIEYYSKINSNTGNTPAVGAIWGDMADLIASVVHLAGDETISGTKTFSTSPIVPTPTTTGNIITMGNIIQKTAVGIGYGTGSGGSVTQLTNKSTAVTLNKPTGKIIMNNAALAAGASVVFSVSNSVFNALLGDTVALVGFNWGFNYEITTRLCSSGAFVVNVKNITETSRSEALEINFTIIKGANS